MILIEYSNSFLKAIINGSCTFPPRKNKLHNFFQLSLLGFAIWVSSADRKGGLAVCVIRGLAVCRERGWQCVGKVVGSGGGLAVCGIRW